MEEINKLIDSDSNDLSFIQKKLLRIFLTGENFFIPYTLDGNWHFADSMKVIDKVELVEALLGGNWYFDISLCTLDDDVYMVVIYLNDTETKNKILDPYKRFKDHYLKDNIKSNIEVYVPYSYMLKIYKNNLIELEYWENIIQTADL